MDNKENSLSVKKWQISAPPKLVTSNHSNLSYQRALKPVNSNLSLLSVSSATSLNSQSRSSTSLVRKMLTVDDIKININEDQLDEFKIMMIEAFRQVVFKK